ncbi:MAG: hypothetical protein VKL39_07305, partial [Leptolyngbyaceae bacterium]|nr:hypothetical protein [Leptolyngbyaceae bacterium]
MIGKTYAQILESSLTLALSRGATVYTQVPFTLFELDFGVQSMLENPILIHAHRLKGAAFGDKRLEKRGLH